jgi:DNA-binding XRE family transcriptional regulator
MIAGWWRLLHLAPDLLTAITVIKARRDRLRGHRLTFHPIYNMTVLAVTKSFPDRYNGQSEIAVSPRPYSRLTKDALTLLGGQVRLARKQRGMTEVELAERAGIARSTLQLIEKGDPRVEIGLVFEAATLTGVSLFVPEASSLAPQIERLEDKLALLPRSIRRPKGTVNDEF